jgi:hypothetical protein
MLKSAQSHGLPMAHLLFGLPEKFSFIESQRVVCIHQPLGLDDKKALMSFKSYKITCVEMEFLSDLLGDHDLAALPDAADNGGFLLCHSCHTFRLSDCQK